MYTTLDQVGSYLETQLITGAATLGLAAVYYSDERITPRYPTILIVPIRREKQRHATGNVFRYDFEIHMFVMHSSLQQTRRLRNIANLQLVDQITGYVEQDRTLGGNVTDGFVTMQEPAILPFPKGIAVVSTRMAWRGFSIDRTA